MFLNLSLQLQQLRKTTQFYINKSIFSAVQSYDQKKYTGSFSKNVYRLLSRHLLYCIVLAFFLAQGDLLLIKEIPELTLKHDLFLNVSIGGLGIAGVILGLYCSNMATIYSSKYTNAPNTLAQTFQQDVITGKCLRQIVGYIILSVILILECIAEIPLSYVSALGYLFLTIRMIITFSAAGNRSYFFSDTFRIAGNLYPKMLKAIQRVSDQKYWANDVNFQNYFQKTCSQQLRIMADISEYNTQNPMNQNPTMLDFMKNNLYLLEQYWSGKSGIYYDSYWWQKQADYPQWHRATDSEIMIALQTGTTLQTKEKANYCWFEEALEKANGICFDKLCRDRDYASIYNYLAVISDISGSALGPETLSHWISYTASLHRQVLPLLTEAAETDVPKTANTDTDKLGQLTASISDVISLNCISLIVGTNKYLDTIDTPALNTHVISKRSFKELNFSRYPFLNQEMIQRMCQHIEAEHAIESCRITPDWFMVQTASLALYRYLDTIMKALIQVQSDLLSIGKQLIEHKCYFQAALIFSRFPEVHSKTSLTIQRLEPLLALLEETHVEKNILWSDNCLEQLKEQISHIQKLTPKYMVTCAKHFTLSHWSARTDYPDLLGQCYNFLCEYILESIENDDFSLFQAAYKGFFHVAVLYQEYVRTDVVQIREKHLQRITFHVFAAPVIEFAKLSGFAILWGEFSKNTDWKDFVEEELHAFLESCPTEGTELLEHMTVIATEYKKPLFGIGNRDVIHTNWEQRISNMIRQSKYFQVKHGPYLSEELVTESSIIKTFCRSFRHHLAGDTEDIYFLLCINPHLNDDKKYQSRYRLEDEDEIS